MLEIRETSARFQPAARQNLRTKINYLNEEKSGILRKLAPQKSPERFHLLLYGIVVI